MRDFFDQWEKQQPGVPEENVLDLRRILEDRKKAEQPMRQPNFLNRFTSPRRPRSNPLSSYRFVGHVSVRALLQRIGNQFRSFARSMTPKPQAVRPPWSRPYVHVSSWVATLALLVFVMGAGYAFVQLQPIVREVRGRVLGDATEGYAALENAKASLAVFDLPAAASAFQAAAESFARADAELHRFPEPLLDILSLLPGPGQELRSGRHLLIASQTLSESVHTLTALLDTFNRQPIGEQPNFIAVLETLRKELENLQPSFTRIRNELAEVDERDIPLAYRDAVVLAKDELPRLEGWLVRTSAGAQVLVDLFGGSNRRTLVLFQNSRELRPTGGFVGSLAYLSFQDGRVSRVEVPAGGSYDLAGQLVERVAAPRPLQLVNPYWNIQDVNWFPDFPTSARKAIAMFEQTAGFTPDNVVAFTPAVIEDLLSVIGPFDVSATHGVTVTAENFVNLTQEQIENASDERAPKQFIADLLPLLLDRTFSSPPSVAPRLAAIIARRLAEKDILLFSADGAVEQRIIELGWGGAILPAAQDFLMIVNANIGGGKTDHVIEELVQHAAEVQADGTIIDTVTLIRRHHGDPNDRYTKTRNVDYVRIYVPSGSEFFSADGFEVIPAFRYQSLAPGTPDDPDLLAVEGKPIVVEPSGTRVTQEFGKTVFGNWIGVSAGETSRATIKYRLPFRLDVDGFLDETDRYELFVQKQPGANDVSLFAQVTFPGTFEIKWASDRPAVRSAQRTVQFRTPLLTDEQYAVVVGKNDRKR